MLRTEGLCPSPALYLPRVSHCPADWSLSAYSWLTRRLQAPCLPLSPLLLSTVPKPWGVPSVPWQPGLLLCLEFALSQHAALCPDSSSTTSDFTSSGRLFLTPVVFLAGSLVSPSQLRLKAPWQQGPSFQLNTMKSVPSGSWCSANIYRIKGPKA